MSEKEKSIIDAAIRVFSRYGVKRASMQDIAEEAGIARQTLYNSFSNKDDILRASIRFYTEGALAAIDDQFREAESVRDKVRIVLTEIALKPYVSLHNSPNAQDLIDGFNAAGRQELEDGAVQYRAVLRDVLAPHETRLAEAGLSVAGLAELLQRAGAAFKYQAENEAHLAGLLDGLVALAAAAAGE